MSHPFEHIESLLQKPAATGMFIISVNPSGEYAQSGLQPGDTIVAIEDEAVGGTMEFYRKLRPKSPDDKKRNLRLLRGGKALTLSGPCSARGASMSFVSQGECAWENKPDYEGEPDFSAFHHGAEYWLRNAFGAEPAGVQHNRISHVDGRVQIDIDFCLGGDGEHQWEYRTRARSIHLMHKHLDVVETAFWEGTPLTCQGDVRRDAGGSWRGMRRTGQNEPPVERSLPALHPVSVYAAMLLPMTMPLREGACLTHTLCYDGRAESAGRARMECLGKAKVEVGGKKIEAWKFAWRHYGKRAESEDEKIYVNDRHEIVRVDWGDHYNNCWCELLPKAQALKGLPKILRLT